jgi:CHAD domain-containing protein
MSFRIKRRESVRHAVRRVVAREVRAARKDAADDGAPLEERVHAVRLHLKRARAALRLVRAKGRRELRETERALRDAARLLAPARDAAIARATLRDLGAPASPPRASDAADLAKAAAALEPLRLRRRAFAAHGADRSARRAFVRGYRAARRGLRDLRPDDSAERFHAWRKIVKRLALQSRLLSRRSPALARELREPLERLAELLGDLHDLAVLEAQLETTSDSLPRLQARAATLRAQARTLGARTLAPRPRVVRRRVTEEWRD